MHQPDATIVIATRNRKDELRKALLSARNQSVDVEILVMDDASSDGTASMIADEFPGVRLVHSPKRVGLIVQRNRAAALASSPVIFSLDDDAVFSTPTIVEQTLQEFTSPRIGAVAIPLYEVSRDELWQEPPDFEFVYAISWFKGGAHALRRDTFLEVGGYRSYFVHQGEEEDYCIRMMQRGFVARLGAADPVHHFASPIRDLGRREYFDGRNRLLFAALNVPFPEVLLHSAGVILNTIRLARLTGHARIQLRGLLDGCVLAAKARGDRAPVSRATYRVNRRLKKKGLLPVANVLPKLPPP